MIGRSYPHDFRKTGARRARRVAASTPDLPAADPTWSGNVPFGWHQHPLPAAECGGAWCLRYRLLTVTCSTALLSPAHQAEVELGFEAG